MAGVGAVVGLRVHWTGVMATGLGVRFSGICVTGKMVALGGNVVVVSFGTLGEGVGQSVWRATVGEV